MIFIPTVYVLDDSQERINSLRKTFGFGIDFKWYQTVASLIEAVSNESGEISSIILDHDLNGHLWNDTNGQNGLDAAKMLNVGRNIPILIWSWNQPRSAEMQNLLLQRGYKTVKYSAFDPNNMTNVTKFIYRSLMK